MTKVLVHEPAKPPDDVADDPANCDYTVICHAFAEYRDMALAEQPSRLLVCCRRENHDGHHYDIHKQRSWHEQEQEGTDG